MRAERAPRLLSPALFTTNESHYQEIGSLAEPAQLDRARIEEAFRLMGQVSARSKWPWRNRDLWRDPSAVRLASAIARPGRACDRHRQSWSRAAQFHQIRQHRGQLQLLDRCPGADRHGHTRPLPGDTAIGHFHHHCGKQQPPDHRLDPLARARFPANVPRAKVPLEWPPPKETEEERKRRMG
jgi:hypothetical protein